MIRNQLGTKLHLNAIRRTTLSIYPLPTIRRTTRKLRTQLIPQKLQRITLAIIKPHLKILHSPTTPHPMSLSLMQQNLMRLNQTRQNQMLLSQMPLSQMPQSQMQLNLIKPHHRSHLIIKTRLNQPTTPRIQLNPLQSQLITQLFLPKVVKTSLSLARAATLRRSFTVDSVSAKETVTSIIRLVSV